MKVSGLRILRIICGICTAAAVFISALACDGITVSAADAASAGTDDTAVISLLHKYDSTDTAVVRTVNTDASTVTLCQHELGRYYTLSVDNTSMVYDRYERPISTALLKPGDVVDATFLRQSKHLNSLIVSDAAWVRENVTDFSFDAEHEIFNMEGQNYHLPGTALLLSSADKTGRRILMEEILRDDVLKVAGIDKEIYSIVVTSGHGYLRLSSSMVGDRDITGAWLNLENKAIRRVTDKTILSVPEGSYKMQVIGAGANDERQITIVRGGETVIDSSTIHMEEPDMTPVTFEIEPEDAEVTMRIDGETVAYKLPIYLSQGVHDLRVKSEEYLDITRKLNVGKKPATVRLELEKDPEAASNAASSAASSTASTADTASTDATSGMSGSEISGEAGTGATDAGTGATDDASAGSGATTVTYIDASGNETTRTTMPGFTISVESPYGAEFYLDDTFMGRIPLSFEKVTGTHTVTLREDGYATRSYSIFIDDADRDKTYAFPAMERTEPYPE